MKDEFGTKLIAALQTDDDKAKAYFWAKIPVQLKASWLYFYTPEIWEGYHKDHKN
jgi:hypothetical protein